MVMHIIVLGSSNPVTLYQSIRNYLISYLNLYNNGGASVYITPRPMGTLGRSTTEKNFTGATKYFFVNEVFFPEDRSEPHVQNYIREKMGN